MWDNKIFILSIVMFLLVLPMAFATNFTTNMKACWNWDGDATDDFLGNFDGTVTGATNTEPYGGGLGGGAYEFTGNGGIAIGGVSTDFNMVGVTTTLFCYNTTQTTFGTMFGSDGTGARGAAIRTGEGGDVGKVRFADELDGDPLITSTTALNNGDINCLVVIYESGSAKLYVNGILNGSDTGTLNNPSVQTYFGRRATGISNFTGWIGISAYWEDRALNASEITELETALRSGSVCPTFTAPPPTPTPTFETPSINKSNPRTGFNLNFSVKADDETSLSMILLAHNMSGTMANVSNITVADPTTTFNFTVTAEVTPAAGTHIGFQFCANNTNNNFACSVISSFIVAGTTPPNVTIHENNFFVSDNSTIISLTQTSAARLNFSFTDDIDLFGFVLNITFNDNLIFNLTNLTLDGLTDNFGTIINFSGPQGTYKANLTVADTHTAKTIPNYDIRKGFSWLEYDRKIRIEAGGAIWASTKKHNDRYDFRFRYLPLIAPKNKVFYIESDNPLIYQSDSIFKAHFVDYKNKRWIDFEGLEGQPKVTKINDRRWKIEFTNSDSEIIFNSIGGLNEDSFQFEFYVSNVSLSFFDPEQSPKNFLGTSFPISLNVTGNGRNTTQFRLYNSSKNLIGSANVSATGIGTYFYNATFTGLSGTQFFVNATHIDINGQIANSTTVTFDSIQVEDCSAGFPAINFTIRDELNSSKVRGDSTAVFDYNGTIKDIQFTNSFTNQDNFSICIFPARESLLVDYEITYEATAYPQRVSTVSDISFNNATQTANIFLLRTVDGIFATFRIIDSFQNPLSGVTSSFAKAGVTIETRDTDDAGIVSFFVSPDTTYIFTFTLAGFTVSTNSLRVTTGDIITITLESEAEEQVTSFATGITYFFQPQNKILNNNTNITFSFNLTSSFWNMTGCTLRLKNASEELSQGDCQFNGSQSNVSIIFNTGNQSIIIAEAEYELNGTTNNTVSNIYRVENIFVGTFSLRNFLDDITNFSAGAFNDFNRFLIGILITLLVVGGLSLQSADFREAEILIPVTWLMVALFSYLGWFNIPLDTIPQIRGLPEDWLNKWNLFILISLLGGAYLVRKHLK